MPLDQMKHHEIETEYFESLNLITHFSLMIPSCGTLITFKLTAAGLIREKNLSVACRVWKQMMENGFTFDRGLSETLIYAIKASDAP